MNDRRMETRLLCADLVDIRWKDKAGRSREVTVSLDDISETGACVQFETPVPLGTRVEMTCAGVELTGEVRYCLFREIGYFVGLEFDPGCQWKPDEYQPKHLLDPRSLLGED